MVKVINFFENRIISEALFIIRNNATVRKTAKEFGVGKSTVHKDVTKTLKGIDISLYNAVKTVLQTNLKERHIRGGIATKKRYQTLKELKKEIAITK